MVTLDQIDGDFCRGYITYLLTEYHPKGRVTMADLKGTLNTVVEKLYGAGTKTRFRPHHFPFTEPSCEMDVQCHKCGGVGCPTCKGEGWIELLGAEMWIRDRPRWASPRVLMARI